MRSRLIDASPGSRKRKGCLIIHDVVHGLHTLVRKRLQESSHSHPRALLALFLTLLILLTKAGKLSTSKGRAPRHDEKTTMFYVPWLTCLGSLIFPEAETRKLPSLQTGNLPVSFGNRAPTFVYQIHPVMMREQRGRGE